MLTDQWTHQLENQLMKAMNSAALFIVFWRLLFSGFYSFLYLWELAITSFIGVLVWIWIYFLTKNSYRNLPFVLCFVEIVFSTMLTVFSLGWNSGTFFSFFLLLPIIMFNGDIGKPIRTFYSLFVILLAAGLFFFSQHFSSSYYLIPAFQNAVYLGNMVFVCVALVALTYSVEVEKMNVQTEIVNTNQKLMTLANTDPLTELLNRRVMMSYIEKEKEKVDLGSRTFSLIMLDVDNFKQINDEYGHDGGDFVLQKLSELIRMSVRSHDLISRWGGDEFLILLLETDLRSCERVAEKLRLRVVNSPFIFHGLDIPVTITLGISVCDKNSGIGNVLRKADLALYKGKQEGKNRSAWL